MKKRWVLLVIVLLLLCAGGTWGWYYATQKPDSILVVRGPAAPPPAWQKATSTQRTAAIQSITAQLDAFKKDNYDLAATYQSQALKSHFASTSTFRQMMISQYPQFTHYKKAAFGPARSHTNGQVVEIPITLVGSDNVTVHAIYTMQLEKGKYRVAGVAGGGLPAPAKQDEDSIYT